MLISFYKSWTLPRHEVHETLSFTGYVYPDDVPVLGGRDMPPASSEVSPKDLQVLPLRNVSALLRREVMWGLGSGAAWQSV